MIFNMGGGGVIPKETLDATTITPGTTNNVIDAGTYLRGDLTVLGDPDLVAENIMYNANIFGVQGNRELKGINVWRKNEILQPKIEVENPAIYIQYGTGITEFPILATDFDMTLVKDWKTFFNGFVSEGHSYSDTKKMTLDSSNNLYYYYTYQYSIKVNNIIITSSQTGSIVLNNSISGAESSNFTMRYTGTKLLQDYILNPLYFIVSDDPDEYPNGEHTDGYYYELIGQISSANVASLSDEVVATVQADYRDQIVEEVNS